MSNQNQKDPAVVKISNVRLSYPWLFKPQQGKNQDGTPNGKYQFAAVFLLHKVKNADDIKRLTDAALAVKKAKWNNEKVNLAGKSIRDGSEKEATEGYGSEVVFISARCDTKPGIVDGQLNELTVETGKPYAGCYVNATVRAWAQDNKNGKRINWSLRNVQFVRDGEPFGEKKVQASEEFDVIEEESSVDKSPAGAPDLSQI